MGKKLNLGRTVGRKLHTLVPTLDHLADTDLSDKGAVPDQSKVR